MKRSGRSTFCCHLTNPPVPYSSQKGGSGKDNKFNLNEQEACFSVEMIDTETGKRNKLEN